MNSEKLILSSPLFSSDHHRPFTMWFGLTFTDEVELIDLSDPQPGQVGWFFEPELLAWFPGEVSKPKKPRLVDGKEVKEMARGFEVYSPITKKSFRFDHTSAAVSPTHSAPTPSPVVAYGLAEGKFFRVGIDVSSRDSYEIRPIARRHPRWDPTAELLARFRLTPAAAAFNQARLGTSLWERFSSLRLMAEKREIDEEPDPIRQVERREEYEEKLAAEREEADGEYDYEVGDPVRLEVRYMEDGGWSLGEVTRVDRKFITVRISSAYNRGNIYYLDLRITRGRDEWMIVPADDDHPWIVYRQAAYKRRLYPIVDLQMTAEGDQLALLKGVAEPVPIDELSDPERAAGPLHGGFQLSQDPDRDAVFIDPRQPTPSLITRKEEVKKEEPDDLLDLLDLPDLEEDDW